MRSLRRTFGLILGLSLPIGATSLIHAAAGPPIILTPPGNVTVPVGAPALFNVGVDGTPPFTYQWLRNGSAIPDAPNSPFYLLPASATNDDNAVFAVQVANVLGDVTSSNALLRVLVPFHTFKVEDEKSLYNSIQAINWEDYMDVTDTLAIDTVLSSDLFTHSQYFLALI